MGAALAIISDQIASFPLHVFEAAETGERKRVMSDATRLLWGAGGRTDDGRVLGPNPEIPAFVFWRLVAMHKVLRENVFLFVVRNNAGEPIELWPLNPTRVRVGRLEDGRKVYELDGKVGLLDWHDGGEIVHVVGDSEDGLVGIGPLERYASSLEHAITAEEYASRMFSQDATPGGVLETSQNLTQERAEELKARWMLSHSGSDAWRTPAVLTNDLKWKSVSFNPEETQMIESRRFSIAQVSRIFRVPPHLLGDVERSTSWGAGISEQNLQWLRTLVGHIGPIEQTLTMAFLPEDQWAHFNADAVLRATTLERYQAHEIALRSRFITPNEVRSRENMAPIEGGDELPAPPNASIPAEARVRNTNESGSAEKVGRG